MALTRDFRETVQARAQRDARYRRGLLSDAIEALLNSENALGREILRDYINATLGFPALAERTGIHVKTLHQMFGPKGEPHRGKTVQHHCGFAGRGRRKTEGGGVRGYIAPSHLE